MKIGMTARLFLFILSATGLAVVLLLIIMWWSINRGFYQYLGAMDQKRLSQISEDLTRKYNQNGSWHFLQHDPPQWNSIGPPVSPPTGTDRPPMPFQDDKLFGHPAFKPKGNTFSSPPPPKNDRYDRNFLPQKKEPPDPLIILNADKISIYGARHAHEEVDFQHIIVRGNTVGYIGVLSPRHFLDPMQIRFLAKQKKALFFAAAAMVIIVMLISWPLSNRLVKPIRQMAAATHDIASGKYTTRISVSSNDELGALARDFNAMAQTLEKNEKARRQWVADISHELRTPVAVLQGEIEALLDGIRKTTPESIRSLHAETLRLKRLVEDLYQLSISDLGALNYRKQNLDLLELLKDSIESYRLEFKEKHIALEDCIARGKEAIGFADPERLGQLFANLLENSLRYTGVGGQLKIQAEVLAGFVLIEFQDSKPGVPPEDMEKIFNRFYRSEQSRNRASGGAGLGLTISRKIVEAHDGEISAHTSPLGGLAVRIKIPVF